MFRRVCWPCLQCQRWPCCCRCLLHCCFSWAFCFVPWLYRLLQFLVTKVAMSFGCLFVSCCLLVTFYFPLFLCCAFWPLFSLFFFNKTFAVNFPTNSIHTQLTYINQLIINLNYFAIYKTNLLQPILDYFSGVQLLCSLFASWCLFAGVSSVLVCWFWLTLAVCRPLAFCFFLMIMAVQNKNKNQTIYIFTNFATHQTCWTILICYLIILVLFYVHLLCFAYLFQNILSHF